MVPRPDSIRIADDDRRLAAMLADGSGGATGVASGDLFRTLGSRPIGDRDELLEVTLDLLDVRLDDSEPVPAVAHVLVRNPWYAGGWWRGEILAVMNAEFVGDLDVAPRGHPNDGRVETFRVGSDTGVRRRWDMWRRLPGARHLPHPEIASRSIRSAQFEFERDMVVIVDGDRIGRARRLHVDVIADAAVLHA